MNTALTPSKVSSIAPRIDSVKKGDLQSFMEFYTHGRMDKQYVLVSHFLEWKLSKPIRTKENKGGIKPRDWTFAFRRVAADIYSEDEEAVIKKDPNGFLLFDAQFMLDNFDRAQDYLIDKFKRDNGFV